MQSTVNELRYFDKKFPQETIEEAVKNKEEITPILLEELDKVIENPELASEDMDYMMHMYALFLLAQFKEERAFSRVIDLISFSSEVTDRIFGDVITEDLSSILYSTFDGDLNRLKSVIENPSLNVYARGAALDVYGRLYTDELVSKEEIIDFLRGILAEESRFENDDIATSVQKLVVDRRIFEMMDDIQILYDDNRIDRNFFGAYDEFVDAIYSYEYDRETIYYIEDTIEEMSWWGAFEQTEAQKREKEKRVKEIEKELAKEEQNKKKKPKKVGRNDPCPCGSGKKYKKCCLKKDRAAKKSNLETAEEQSEWLKDYPTTNGERQENESRITDDFDDESIEIDRLVYLALHRRPIPMWVDRDYEKEKKRKIAYLKKALDKFIQKVEKEKILSFEDYDRHYKIHFRSQEWVGRLHELVRDNRMEDETTIKKADEILNKMQ